MKTDYSYLEFHAHRDPRRPLNEQEYLLIQRDLNGFMQRMLTCLYSDEDLFGQTLKMKTTHLLTFLALAGVGIAGMIFLPHPSWIALSAFTGIIMLVAALAVPVTYWQDQNKYRLQRQNFVQETKSYYLYQYSMIRKTNTYSDYVKHLPQANLSMFEKYLQRYLG